MKKNSGITVVIPTRERCDVLAHSLRTVTEQNHDELTILVSDNASSDETRDVVAAANDPRIRYINTGARVSMTANWEFALANAGAGWITFMGDDDGLMPQAIQDVAAYAADSDVKAIRSRPCIYDWPSVLARGHGRLIIPMGNGQSFRRCDAWLARTMDARAKYTELPMVYNGGFVRKEIFDGIKSKCGKYFNSAVPDVFAALAVTRSLDRYLFVEKPLAISGTSKHSTGTSTHSSLKDQHQQPARAYYTEGNLPFHPDLPLNADGSYPHSLHALVYECYLQSKDLGSDGVEIDHQRQLELILGSDTPHQASINAWAEKFSKQHSLDLQAARRAAGYRAIFTRPLRLLSKTFRAANSVVVDNDKVSLSNVYQASIAASVVRSRPTRLSTLPQLLKRRINQRV